MTRQVWRVSSLERQGVRCKADISRFLTGFQLTQAPDAFNLPLMGFLPRSSEDAR
jgi:hypothetical protein